MDQKIMVASSRRRDRFAARGGSLSILPAAIVAWITSNVAAFVGPAPITPRKAFISSSLSSSSACAALLDPSMLSDTQDVLSSPSNLGLHGILDDMSSTPLQLDNSILLSVSNLGSEVGDTLRTIIFGVVGFVVAIFGVAVLYLALVLPKQIEGFEEIVKNEAPEKYEAIKAKLNDGETLIQRQDLMEELVDAGLTTIAEEGDAYLQELIDKIKKEKKETGKIDLDRFDAELVERLDMNIEEYLEGIKNFENNDMLRDTPIGKKFVTDKDRELAALLTEELEL